MRDDLQAGLLSSNVQVVLAETEGHIDDDTGLAAQVCVAKTGGDRVTIEIDDALTNKRLVRDIDLRQLPQDGRDLALALAADELLRASWAELGLRNDKPPTRSRTEPAAADALMDDNHIESRKWRASVTLGPTIRYTGGSSWFVGGELGFGWARGPWYIRAHGSGQWLVPLSSVEGKVSATAWGGGVAAFYQIISGKLAALGPTLGVDVSYLKFQGRGGEQYSGQSLPGIWTSARAGLFSTLRLGSSLLVLQAGGERTLSAVRAQIAGRNAAQAAGFGFWAGLVGGAEF
jgi:hypothetical protein